MEGKRWAVQAGRLNGNVAVGGREGQDNDQDRLGGEKGMALGTRRRRIGQKEAGARTNELCMTAQEPGLFQLGEKASGRKLVECECWPQLTVY